MEIEENNLKRRLSLGKEFQLHLDLFYKPDPLHPKTTHELKLF